MCASHAKLKTTKAVLSHHSILAHRHREDFVSWVSTHMLTASS